MPGFLVTYASLTGSTQEVAEAVAATLHERGIEVDCRPMRDVRSVQAYSAVVIGAAIYFGRLHKDARSFLSRFSRELVEQPVAIFAMGPFHDDPKEWHKVRTELDKAVAKFPWFNPRAREVFGGRFDGAKLPFPYTLLPVLKGLPTSDIRDWEAIRAWARRVADLLQSESGAVLTNMEKAGSAPA